jgi:hypothetical protein
LRFVVFTVDTIQPTVNLFESSETLAAPLQSRTPHALIVNDPRKTAAASRRDRSECT